MNVFPDQDALILPGAAVKALDTQGRFRTVGGYLVVFGDPTKTDLAGDYFTAKTDFGPLAGNGAMALLHHTIPIKGIEKRRDYQFKPWKTTKDDFGIFAETVLDMADNYEATVHKVIAQGKMGLSSGSAAHLVRRRENKTAGEVTVWPIVEGSFTPTPCEPRARVGAQSLKALLELPTGAFDVPQEVMDEFARMNDLNALANATTMSALERSFRQSQLIAAHMELLRLTYELGANH